MYLTWTTSSFGLHPEGWQPSQPHLVATDNADYLSERCEMVPKNRVRQDETEQNVLSDHVEYGKGSGGAYRIRTDDILLAKQALYQLS